MDNEQLSIFNCAAWKIKFIDAYYAHKAIEKCLLYAQNGNEYLEEDIDDLEAAFSINSKQMIILFCTYTEVMLKDFLYTVFREKPYKIEKFLPNEFSEHFNKLLSKNTLDIDSIDIFASIAAKKSFDFKINKTINIICDISKENHKEASICKSELSDIKSDIYKIFELRNNLIHENKPPKIDIEMIVNIIYLKVASKIINQLDSFCDELNISAVKERKQKEISEELRRSIEKSLNSLKE